jgi:hypothetical protein
MSEEESPKVVAEFDDEKSEIKEDDNSEIHEMDDEDSYSY